MEFNNNYSTNFVKTNAILKSAVLGGYGWEANIVNPEVLTSMLAYGYVFDHATNWLWMFSSAREAFQVVPDLIKANSTINNDAIYDSFGSLIKQASNGELQINEPEQWVSMLSNALLAYSGTTKTWELANKLIDGGHFVVLRYPRKNGDGYLRPFYLSATGSEPLSLDKLTECISHITTVDRENHPEWFGS